MPLIRYHGLGYSPIVVPARQAIFLQKVLSELKTLKFNNIQADLELNQEGCL